MNVSGEGWGFPGLGDKKRILRRSLTGTHMVSTSVFVAFGLTVFVLSVVVRGVVVFFRTHGLCRQVIFLAKEPNKHVKLPTGSFPSISPNTKPVRRCCVFPLPAGDLFAVDSDVYGRFHDLPTSSSSI